MDAPKAEDLDVFLREIRDHLYYRGVMKPPAVPTNPPSKPADPAFPQRMRIGLRYLGD